MNSLNEQKEYLTLRKSILNGNLYYMRTELTHVLYRVFLKIIKFLFKLGISKDYDNKKKDNIIKNFMLFMNDFKHIDQYNTDLNYLNNIFNGYYNLNTLKEDVKFNNILNKNHIIFLSKYTFETFLTYIEMMNLKFIHNTLIKEERCKLIVIENISEESYSKKPGISTNIKYSSLKNLNSLSITMGMLREDYNLINKLDELYIRKYSKNRKYENNFLHENYKRYPIEKAFNSLLSSTPDLKIKYLFDFSKDYLNKIPYELNEEPNILKIELNDYEFKINTIEISKDFKLIILGYENGKIKVYDLSNNDNLYYNNLKNEEEEIKKPDEENKDEEEVYVEIKENKYILGKTRIEYNNLPNLFNNSVKVNSFIGHSSGIVVIRINYDNCYFISGDMDGDIRIWNSKINNCLGVYKIHYKNIWDIDISPKGYHFLSCSEDGVAYLWNMNRNSPLKNYFFQDTIPKLCKFSFNLLYGIFACDDKSVYLYNLEDCNLLRFFQNHSEIMTINLNYTGDTLFLGNYDGSISIWNLENLKLEKIVKFDNNKQPIRNLSLSVDENFVTVSNKYKIAFYKMNDFRNLQSENIFEKYGIDKIENINNITPIKSYDSKVYDIINSFSNNQNLIIMVTRKIINK